MASAPPNIFSGSRSTPVRLAAGPLSLLYENGYVRSVRINEVEIVRRIYMALRDEHWNTIPGEMYDVVIERDSRSFFLSYSSRHRTGEIDFLWQAELRGSDRGELTFAMQGTALSRFRRNRIGLCVLHPLSCKGRQCRVTTASGATEDSLFPVSPAPWPVFRNVRALTYAVQGSPAVTVRFEGDVFETEDQRNWTDATYKTYPTPVALPVPAVVEKGETIRQTVSISFDKTAVRPAAVSPRPLQLAFGKEKSIESFPSIGTLASPQTGPMVSRPFAASHFRVEVRFEKSDVDSCIFFARRLYEKHGVPVELALHCSIGFASEISLLDRLLEAGPFPIARFLVYKNDERSTSLPVITAAREKLCRRVPGSLIVSGTDGYFAEINRANPPAGFLDGVCFGATPQVHTFDNTAIMENLEGLSEAIAAAQSLADGKNVVLSPLTLRPRRRADLPFKDGGPDDRSRTLFGAAWTLGAIVKCCKGRVSSLTLDETDATTPVAVLLSWLSATEQKQFSVLQGESSAPGQLLGIGFRRNKRFMAVATNLTDETVTVGFSGLPEQCGYCMLDELSYGKLSLSPDGTYDIPLQKADVSEGAVSLTLGPYGLVRFEEME